MTPARLGPPVLGPVLALRHRRTFGRFPRLRQPITFNEKVLHRMLFDRRSILTTFSGKFESREWVRARTGDESLLPTLVGTARDESDLRRLRLPERYVVKANHMSGLLRFVERGEQPDLAELGRTIASWCRRRSRLQWGYQGVQRTAVIEEFLGQGTALPADYKLFCFDGRVSLLMVDRGRFAEHVRDFFDVQWRPLPLRICYPPSARPPEPPAALERMVRVAEQLSVGIDFVRVDLYDVDGVVKVGELTAYPAGGDDVIEPPSWDVLLGARWTLPDRRRLRGCAS